MNRIKELRTAKGITQTKLAEDANVTQPFINDLEHGRRGAKPDTFRRIAEALGVTPEELEADEKVG